MITYLEQTGHARLAFVLNALYFSVILGIALALPQPVFNTDLSRLLAAGNIAGFFTLLLSALCAQTPARPRPTGGAPARVSTWPSPERVVRMISRSSGARR